MANQVKLKKITTDMTSYLLEYENYIPAPGEAIVVHFVDTEKTELKIGNGVATIKELPYIQTSCPAPIIDYGKYVCADCGHLCKINKNKVYAVCDELGKVFHMWQIDARTVKSCNKFTPREIE